MSYGVQSLVEKYLRFKMAQSTRRDPLRVFMQFCKDNKLSPTQVRRLRMRLENTGRM